MGSSRRETDASEQDYTDSRSGGEAYQNVGKGFYINITVVISVIVLVVIPCTKLMYDVRTNLESFEVALDDVSSRIRPPHTEWTRFQQEQFTAVWSQDNPDHKVPDTKDFGFIGLDGQFHYPE